MKTRVWNGSKESLEIRQQPRKHSRSCNLCMQAFAPNTVFERFCSRCRDDNELLRFSEWLPELDEEIQEKIPA